MIYAWYYVYQNPSISYYNNRWIDIICSTNEQTDDVQCLNNISESWKYFIFWYKKINWKYSKVVYKLPNDLVWEFTINYDIDLKNKNWALNFVDLSGDIIHSFDIDFINATTYDNTDFTSFKYSTAAWVTNNTSQKNYPINIWLKFEWDSSINIVPEPTVKPITPIEFQTSDITHNSAKLNWSYTFDDSNKAKNLYLKDENDNIIVDNISSTSEIFTEKNLLPNTLYSRTICAINSIWESCSEPISFTTAVDPDAPKILEFSVYEWKEYYNDLWISAIYTTSQSWIVEVKDHYTWFRRVLWITPWYVEIYAHDYRTQKHIYTFKVTVLPKPIPTEYNLELTVWQYWEIILPEEVSLYDITSTNNSVFDLRHTPIRGQLRIEWSKIFLPARREWSTIITLKEKTGHLFTKYIINVTVKLYEWDYTLQLWETRDPGLNSSDSYNISNRSIVSIRSDDVTWIKLWYTSITSSRDGRNKSKVNIEVIPVRDPTIIECETLMWDRCHFTVTNGWYYYDKSASWVGEIDTWKSSFRVKGLKPGTVNVYIKSRYGNFVTHIFRVTVRSKPLRILDCTAPLWVVCDTNWWGSDREYTYSVSDNTILDLFLYRYSEGVQTYEKLQVTWKQEWTAEVYVYENWEHIVTFTITVEAPVSPIVLEKWSIDLGQQESGRIKIFNGWGEYKKVSYESDSITFRVSNDDSQTQRWEVTISWILPSNTQATLKDKYGQTATITVRVEDTILRLAYPSTDWKLVLNWWDSNYEYIAVMESVQWIKNFSISNDNVEAYLEYVDANWEQQQVIKVIPKKSWETVLVAEDYEGNVESVNIVVEGTITEPDPDDGSISWFYDVIYTDKIETWWVAWIQFNINDQVDEVWVEYTLSDGTNEKQILAIQTDGQYIVAFTEDSTLSSNDFTPYYIKNWVTYYYNQVLIVDYNYILVTDFQVNNIGYQQFQEILSWIWFNKWYNDAYETSSQKVYDIKENTRWKVIDIILQTIATTASLDVDTANITIDTLPVAWYMLNKFLNGPYNDDFYNTNHWISQKVKQTQNYNDIIINLNNNFSLYDNILEWEEIEIIPKTISSFSFSTSSFLQVDLYMAIHGYSYSASVYKQDDILYSKIKFIDEYDFEPNQYWYAYEEWKSFTQAVKDTLSNSLNYLWNYHEKNLDWTPYKWEIEIIDKLN